MITRISEIVHRWLGWCPDQGMTPVRKKAPWREINSHIPPKEGTYVNDGVIIDYGSTGISPLYLIGFGAGITGIVLFFTLIRMANTLLSGILLCGFILSVTIAILYQDIKKASLEITPDSLVIHRVLPWHIVIPKDAIVKAEVRDTVQPVPSWLLAVLLFIVVPVSSVGVIYSNYVQWASGEIITSSFFFHLGFTISIVLFFLAIYYHSRVRSYYRKTLLITTTTGKLVGIYGENMDEMRGMLENPA